MTMQHSTAEKEISMKTTQIRNLLAVALVCVLASTSAFAQGLPTTGTIESLLGKLEIKNG
jgi:C4-dicarboxylate transporter